jgi:hypothetical protein
MPNFAERVRQNPYLMIPPSERPEVVPTQEAEAHPGGLTQDAAILTDVHMRRRLRKAFPEMKDFTSDELIDALHEQWLDQSLITPQRDKAGKLLPFDRKAFIDTYLRPMLAPAVTVRRPGLPAAQLNVPIIPGTEVSTESPSTLPLVPGHAVPFIPTPNVNVQVGPVKGNLNKFVRSTARGLVEDAGGIPWGIANILAGGAEQTPEAKSLRKEGIKALGRGAAFMASMKPLATEAAVLEPWARPGYTVREMIRPEMLGRPTPSEVLKTQVIANASAGAIYGAITGATDSAIEGGSPQTVATTAALSGAAGGAIAGTLGPVFGTGARLSAINASTEAAARIAADDLLRVRRIGLIRFADEFNLRLLDTRLRDVMDYVYRMKTPASPETIAQKVYTNIYKLDPKDIPPEGLARLAQRIAGWMEQRGIEPNPQVGRDFGPQAVTTMGTEGPLAGVVPPNNAPQPNLLNLAPAPLETVPSQEGARAVVPEAVPGAQPQPNLVAGSVGAPPVTQPLTTTLQQPAGLESNVDAARLSVVPPYAAPQPHLLDLPSPVEVPAVPQQELTPEVPVPIAARAGTRPGIPPEPHPVLPGMPAGFEGTALPTQSPTTSLRRTAGLESNFDIARAMSRPADPTAAVLSDPAVLEAIRANPEKATPVVEDAFKAIGLSPREIIGILRSKDWQPFRAAGIENNIIIRKTVAYQRTGNGLKVLGRLTGDKLPATLDKIADELEKGHVLESGGESLARFGITSTPHAPTGTGG